MIYHSDVERSNTVVIHLYRSSSGGSPTADGTVMMCYVARSAAERRARNTTSNSDIKVCLCSQCLPGVDVLPNQKFGRNFHIARFTLGAVYRLLLNSRKYCYARRRIYDGNIEPYDFDKLKRALHHAIGALHRCYFIKKKSESINKKNLNFSLEINCLKLFLFYTELSAPWTRDDSNRIVRVTNAQ